MRIGTISAALISLLGLLVVGALVSKRLALAKELEALESGIAFAEKRLAAVEKAKTDTGQLTALRAETDEYESLEAAVRKAKEEQRHRQELACTVFSEKEVDAKPRTVSQPAPVLPRTLRGTGQTGSALVTLTVGQDGLPRDLELLRASQPEFGEAVMTALKKWRFEPGRKEGQAVNVRLTIPIEFKRDEGKPLSPEQQKFRLEKGWF